MRSNKLHIQLATLMAILILLAADKQAAAQHETVLYSFTGSGGNPAAAVVFDASGNLYGTTARTIFKLTPQTGGGWAENDIYTAPGSLQNVEGSPVFGPGGNLYSVTQGCCRDVTLVFELTPSGGTWTATTLYTFPDTTTHGYQPYGAPTFDSAGNIFSTTYTGGGLTGTAIQGEPCTNCRRRLEADGAREWYTVSAMAQTARFSMAR
jgi:hypothetical protein